MIVVGGTTCRSAVNSLGGRRLSVVTVEREAGGGNHSRVKLLRHRC
jgi:hypothetical protein